MEAVQTDNTVKESHEIIGSPTSAKERCAATEHMSTNDETEHHWGATGSMSPSVTLKMAIDVQGAVDDLSDGAKRFTSPASLDAGAMPAIEPRGAVPEAGQTRTSYELMSTCLRHSPWLMLVARTSQRVLHSSVAWSGFPSHAVGLDCLAVTPFCSGQVGMKAFNWGPYSSPTRGRRAYGCCLVHPFPEFWRRIVKFVGEVVRHHRRSRFGRGSWRRPRLSSRRLCAHRPLCQCTGFGGTARRSS